MTDITRTFALRSTLSHYLTAVAGLALAACSVQADGDALDADASGAESPEEGTGDAPAEPPPEDAWATGGNAPNKADGGSTGDDGTGGDNGSTPAGGSEGGVDPTCQYGIANNAETVCCPAMCGFCGGTGCEDNPGGETNCCAGAIGSSGISCAEAEAPCVLTDNGGTGGTQGTGGAPASGGAPGAGGSDTGECSLHTPVAGLPNYNFTMHNVLAKSMARKDFCDADKWYSEWLDVSGKPVQEFSLHQGDDMADYVDGGRSHQRCEFEDGLWATKGAGDWIEWEGRMLINKQPENTITIGQMFGPNGPDARVEIRTNGSLGVGSLKGGSGNVTLSGENNVGKSFKIKMRTNGDRVEVYFNGEKAVDRPTDGNSGAKWHFRWGVYSNDIPQEPTPLTNTVTELVVTG